MNIGGQESEAIRNGQAGHGADEQHSAQAALRHCMVVHAYYPLGETRVEREALALRKRGGDVDVLCLRGENEVAYEVVDGVKVHRLPMRRFKGFGRLVQLLEYITFFVLVFYKVTALHFRKRYHVVQVHNLPDFLIFSALIPKLMGAKLILDLHDLMPEFFAALIDGTMESKGVRLLAWQERLSCRFADRVITVTDVWKETLIQRGVQPEKIHVVMNVADPRIFQRPPAAEKCTPKQRPPRQVAQALAGHPLPEGIVAPVPSTTNGNSPHESREQEPFRLIYHGTFTHRYGVDLIIEAVAQVREQIPSIQLSLLGGGEFRTDLLALTERLGVQDHVSFSTQVLPATELPGMISRSHIGIVPNRSNIFTDGLLPTKLMEYVAMGVPVIAARTPTIAAYFDRTMLRFFTPGDADDLAQSILALYADPAARLQLAQNAEQFNQQYNWDTVSAEYVQMVGQLVR